MEVYTSDSSDSDNGTKNLDYAYLHLETETVNFNLNSSIGESEKRPHEVETIILHHNKLETFPNALIRFTSLKVLDLSNNGLTELPDIFRFCPLTTLLARNNCLKNESLPKSFSQNSTIKELNLSGNLLCQFPEQILDLAGLKYLYLGGNRIENISRNIYKLNNISILSMGGNELVDVPSTLAQLKNLQVLMLSDNKIETLPANIADLHNLKTFHLHKNRLKTLPPAIIGLKNLTELSLRDNPLVVRFVSGISYNSPTLLELSARIIKLHNIHYTTGDIPSSLESYLNSAHHCVNPKCKGVYFDNRVEHVKFVDFCGKYRIPLLQYLCSSKCMAYDEREKRPPTHLMKKVLLG